MDAKKHPISKALHAGKHPGAPSADKYNGPLPVQGPMDQPDQGPSMDPSMGA